MVNADNESVVLMLKLLDVVEGKSLQQSPLL